uniref:DNA mismatch repair protein MLH3 n=1 Tax=Erigeron canadensis TaxID=72917 RepID=UPI001CB9C7CA|nr:DNA mismatch repair protein MLH3 [Erigeron canadensis]
MRSIKVLPESVRSCMRSGILLFDLTRVVEELVFNSLDAGATKVNVVVGVGSNYIKVTDNGCGITRDGLVLLGERYATSKFEQLAGMNTVPESFGFRGEALSSISDVSLLEVVTKAHGMPNGYRKVIKGCKCLYLGIDDDRQDVGTTVVVRDLFYNQPVKRRHIQSSPKKILHSVKECILRIALVHLGTCFKVIDVESGDELLSLYPSPSPLPLLTTGFGVEVSWSLRKLDESDGKLKLSGYISDPYEIFSVKAVQCFYINSRYISKGPIHKLLNQLAATHSCSHLLKADIGPQCGKRIRCQASSTYILNLTCPRAQYDLSFEPAKTCATFKDWDLVVTFIKKAVSCFWGQDVLNSYGLPKKRCVPRCDQNSTVLFPPQLEVSREEPKHMPHNKDSCNLTQQTALQSEDYGQDDFDYLLDNSLKFSARFSDDKYLETKCSGELYDENTDHLSDATWNDNPLHTGCSKNNRLVVKKPSSVRFNFDDDREINDNIIRSRRTALQSEDSGKKLDFDYRSDNLLEFSARSSEDIYLVTKCSGELSDEDMDHLSDVKRNQNSHHTGCSTNNRLLVKKSSAVRFHFDDGEKSDVTKCSRRTSLQSKDYGMELDFDYLPDNSLKFSDRTSADIYLETKCNGKLFDENMDHLSDAKSNQKTLYTGCRTNNKLGVKKPSAVRFHFDDDRDNTDNIMKPFLRSCSSRMDVLPVFERPRGDDQFRFHADAKKCLYVNNRVDNEEADCFIQCSKPWPKDDETVWSPPKNSSLLLEGSFGSDLTDVDSLVEDYGHWTSPVASVKYSKSSHRSYNCNWSTIGEELLDEPLYDASTRHSKHCRDDGFDLFTNEEGQKDISNLDNMRYEYSWEDGSFLKGHVSHKKNIRNSQMDSFFPPQRCDVLSGTEWAHFPVAASHSASLLAYSDRGKSKLAHHRVQDKHQRRSCSAPPIYRGKRKFLALNNWMTVESGSFHHVTLHDSPTLQEANHQKHIQKPSDIDHLALEEGSASDLLSKARLDKKKVVHKADISDYEVAATHSLDVSNTNSDFTLEENQGALDLGGKWRNGCPLTSSIQKPHDLINQDNILDISSGLLHLSDDSLLPKSMSKKCMEDCRVLQQVDRKFIPVVGGGILAIIDQHAADERIRLEDLREKVLSGETKTITYLDAEQELVLPEIGYQFLSNYSEQIQKWGWICNFHSQSSMSFKKNLNFLHNQPPGATLIAVPCILGVNLTDVDLLEFLQQLADTDGSSVIPPAVLRILNSKACRGAIMFGDALLPSECSLIVEELKQTSMCFQCAHGRPTTAPLVNLVVLHKQIAKLGNWSHGSSVLWHGLSRHRPTLERVVQRLSSEGAEC